MYVQIKGLFVHSSEFGKSHFTQPPEVLYSVDMVASIGKLIFAVLNPKVLFLSVVYQSIVGFKSVGVYNRSCVGFSSYNRHQLVHRTILDHLCIDSFTAL